MELWNGLQQSGGMNLSLGIIGYSMPQYDDYALQVLYHIARNYQHFEPEFEFNGRQKTKVRLIDFQLTEDNEARFRERYRFLDWTRTEALFTGFDSSTAKWILR